ncbi:MAG: chromosome segregation protein SMC [Calditrichaeota bacterium]|nr:MAG: chromosome segregation protein SMC [Calditrichota bacterium]MBL1204218.1 chromosome segregation protein SMC [Calditrichota bacterium]NOG44048.1 chromosome segregation protein SMC [Calditrichota bacterium]
MYLSKLEILGFKSFAQKIKLDFNEGLTCIIGPNGSGKSNIVDAIRWVLGEQRVSSLRSDKMENVIFNGTKKRKPMGLSEVSMTIENNKKILDSEYEEIVISRRLYRSGESQYMINKVPVRLKDVVNLFMDTGMGANSYSVIELKMVESILSENKNERRLLFEEAAGVVKYKTRRKSALRKLDSTQQDLARINDIVIEVEKTVSSLGRQVSKARRFIDLTDQMKKNDIDLAVFRYHKFKDLIDPLETELTEISKEKEESSHQITLEEAILEDYNRQQIEFEQRVSELNKTLYEKDINIRNLNQDDAIAEAKIEDMKKNRERYLNEIDGFLKKITLLNEDKETYTDELEQIRLNTEQLDKQFAEIRKEKEENADLINAEKADIDQLNTKFREQLQIVTEKKELLKQKEYRVNFDKEQIEKINHINSEQDSEISELNEKLDESNKGKIASEAEIEKIKSEISHIQESSTKVRVNITKNQSDYNLLLSDLERTRSRESFLKNIISSYEGHAKSTQFVMSQQDKIDGVYGPLADLIDANEQHALLVESVLKDSLNFIVVENISVAKELIQKVKAENQGRVTCIPLDRVEKIDAPNWNKNGAGLSFLLDNISCSDKFRHLLNILIGDVAIGSSLDELIKLSEKKPGLRFISNDGETVNFSREISGGSTGKKDTTIIGRKNKLKELEKLKEKQDKELQVLKDAGKKFEYELEQILNNEKEKRELLDIKQHRFFEIDNNLKQLSYQLENKKKQLEAADIQTTQLNTQIDILLKETNEISAELEIKQSELNKLEKETIIRTNEFETKNESFQILLDEYQETQLKHSNSQNQLVNRENDLKRNSENVKELETSITRRKQEIENIKESLVKFDSEIVDRKVKREQIWQHRDELDKKKQVLETEFQELKDKRHKLENEIREFRRKHDSSLEKSKKLEIEISEYKYQSEAVRTYASKEYSTDVDAHIPNQNLNEEETEDLLDSLRNRIKNLGPVNPLAVSEHEKESERLEFLTTQRDDLQKAEQSLLETIDKINKTARKQFEETFTAIKENFEKVFVSFFPNGRGTLMLDETDDPLEADIEIEVTTKGRGLQTLSLLSGGEKTLTAISLLFSIYLVKPSPFCILDEVDAPLDDVNIGRFTEALQSFSNNTQFLVVTHNKRTMEAAETMYGVTMEEEGVSKLVSVQFN